jgi:Carbohydrate esterase, sialic acid-specific acetylesterase
MSVKKKMFSGMKQKIEFLHYFVFLGAIVSVQPAQGQLNITSLKDYQVISRTSADKADCPVSGICKSGTTKILLDITGQDDNAVIGSFSNVDIAANIQDTTWNAQLQGLPVGGEYKVRLKASVGSTITDSVLVQHVLVGDVWLASGQSNMQQSAPSNSDPKHVHVRSLYSGSGATPGTGIDNSKWGNGNVTGPGMTFGIEYYKQTGIPVGILLCASGGTSINDWFALPDRPLFSMMVKLVTNACNFKINGFFWYQGENEDQQDTWAQRYFTKFVPLRDTVRLLAGNPKLPVLAVQLESWDGEGAFALPVARRPRWPVIRDRQELIGTADSLSATVPAWDFAGLHINQQSQGTVGTRAAQIAAGKFFGKKIGTGPLFDAAWFENASRSKIVVKFKNVTGKLINPDDPNHLGFYVMKPASFNINDSSIFDYGTTAKSMLTLKSVTMKDNDKVVIELDALPSGTDSLTVGYGRHINLIKLTPLTDSSSIPVCTFFDRPIQKEAPVAAVLVAGHASKFPVSMDAAAMDRTGRFVLKYSHPNTGTITITLFSLDGKKALTLLNGQSAGGSHEISFDSVTKQIPRGVYLCSMSIEGKTARCLVTAFR